MKNKETIKEKIESLHKASNWNKEHCELFVNLVYDYLDHCGYFHSDFNIHGILSNDRIKYIDENFGKWLIDMALQYNMEQGIEYKCEKINK